MFLFGVSECFVRGLRVFYCSHATPCVYIFKENQENPCLCSMDGYLRLGMVNQLYIELRLF